MPDTTSLISFDLDGTLVDHAYTEHVWLQAVPELVAARRGLPFEEARRWVLDRYREVGEGRLEWYHLDYWYRLFELDGDWLELLDRHVERVRAFPEAHRVLDRLAPRHRLVVISNAARPFLDREMRAAGLEGRFERAISATSDIGEVKKTASFYRRLCRELGRDPHEVIHVGDHPVFDHEAPAAAGLQACYLDRSRKHTGPHVVFDLDQFADRVLASHPA